MGSRQLSLHCECTPVLDTAVSAADGASLLTAVIEAVAAAEDADPTELPPIATSVDLEAAEQLLAVSSSDGPSDAVVGVAVRDWNVFIRDDGRIRVCDPAGRSDPSPVFD